MPIQKDAKVIFELGPHDTPRWIPSPNRVDEFMDARHTGKYGSGYVARVTENMLCIIFNKEYQSNIFVGIAIPIELYNESKHFPGFYDIQIPGPKCECGAGDGNPHWRFCPMWKEIH